MSRKRNRSRALVPVATKAASGPGVISMMYDAKLTSVRETPQEMMKRFLRAYKVTWFYKAESVISFDVSNLEVELKREDGSVVEVPDRKAEFDSLNPIDQCRRLLDQPNPKQTWRRFIEKWMIRMDMAGNNFWFEDELEEQFGTPKALWNISPARMWPAFSKDGKDIIGWVMDWDNRGGGIPYKADEIIHTSYGSAEDDVFGVGMVESVLHEWEVSKLLTNHIADVLTLGGRLAGMVSPKERSLDENEFQDVLRAWRNISASGDAGRRLLVFPEPVEWTRGSATPQEIGLPGLSEINRTNILSAFPISEFRLGVPMAAGLNSGDTRKHMYREYHEFTLHPRVAILQEIVQKEIVDNFSDAAGEELKFTIKEPDRDDAPSLLEKAAAFRALLNLGFDPEAIIPAVGLHTIKWDPLLLQNMIAQAFLGATEAAGQEGAASAVPGLNNPDHVPALAASGKLQTRLPNPLLAGDVGQRINVNDTSRKDNVTVSQSVTTQRKATRFGDVLSDEERKIMRQRMQKEIGSYLSDQRGRIIERVRKSWPSQKASRKAFGEDEGWWAAVEDQELASRLRDFVKGITIAAMEGVSTSMDRVITRQQVDGILRDAEAQIADDVKFINEHTRQAIRNLLVEGARRGYSVNQVVDGVPDEGFSGLQNLLLENGNDVWGDWRAETIARTELLSAFNRGNLLAWNELGVTHVQAHDGDYDADCKARDGEVFPIESAMNLRDHPNGTLGWSPLPRDGGI